MLSASGSGFRGRPGRCPPGLFLPLGRLSLEGASAADDDESGHVDLLSQSFLSMSWAEAGPEELLSLAANVFRNENISLAADVQSAYELPVASLAAWDCKERPASPTLPPAAGGPRSPARV